MHVGTLGSGNHFIEVCLGEHDGVWFILDAVIDAVRATIGKQFTIDEQALPQVIACLTRMLRLPPKKPAVRLLWLESDRCRPEFLNERNGSRV
ncbi:RtcB family protein [Paraburkholderia dipogonis]|uniref:RtcB family protein n=1 Tax=Paraburkholderia dipogonis TaxID=1211383 RepID=UPI00141BE52D|nr:RtcB family protein [Paraburkholderia dipogonis]